MKTPKEEEGMMSTGAGFNAKKTVEKKVCVGITYAWIIGFAILFLLGVAIFY